MYKINGTDLFSSCGFLANRSRESVNSFERPNDLAEVFSHKWDNGVIEYDLKSSPGKIPRIFKIMGYIYAHSEIDYISKKATFDSLVKNKTLEIYVSEIETTVTARFKRYTAWERLTKIKNHTPIVIKVGLELDEILEFEVSIPIGGNPVPGLFKAWYGYTDVDPVGRELELIPQFGLTDISADQLAFNFTKDSAGNYLFVIVPEDKLKFNKWENGSLNFGDIPDFAWREAVTLGDKTYYFSRNLLYITSENPIITFKRKNTLPIQFYFVDIMDALINSMYTSNEIKVENITEPVKVFVSSGGEYQINGGQWVSKNGFASKGDRIKVRIRSASSYTTAVSVTLNVGGVTDSFDVTTARDITIYYAFRTKIFTRNNCGENQLGSNVPFTKEYTATGSQQAADDLANNDSTFESEGQSHANSTGACQVQQSYIWGFISVENTRSVNGGVYSDYYLKTYKGYSPTSPPDAIIANQIKASIQNIGIQFLQAGAYPAGPNNFTVSLTNQDSIRLVPPNTQKYNPVYPSQLVSLPDGTTFSMVFTGKQKGEMILLKTVTP